MCEWHRCLSFFPILKVKQSNVTCELCHDIVAYIEPFVDSIKDKVINTVVTYRLCIFLYTSLAWVFKDAARGLTCIFLYYLDIVNHGNVIGSSLWCPISSKMRNACIEQRKTVCCGFGLHIRLGLAIVMKFRLLADPIKLHLLNYSKANSV